MMTRHHLLRAFLVLRLSLSPMVFGLATVAPSSAINLPLQQLADHASSYAAAHGLQVETRREEGGAAATASGGTGYQCAPISLLPNAYPAASFRKAQSLAAPFNELVDRISRDGDFLDETLGREGGVADADPYTGKLLQLYNQIYWARRGRDMEWGRFARLADRLGVHRSDYMLNSAGDKKGEYQLKQVELNTIASSFGGLAVNVAKLHRHLVSRFDQDVKEFLESNKIAVVGATTEREPNLKDEGVPENPALYCIPFAMNVAHQRYRDRFLSGNNAPSSRGQPVILFIVQDGESNTVDQRMLEFNLWENHEVPVVRMSLTKAHDELELDNRTGALRIKANESLGLPSREVSVAYFRAGYTPTDYPDGDDGIEWRAREMIERSRATKCPCLGYHLAGTKKVQQELARPGTLERFFPKEGERMLVEGMREAFAGLYSLGDDVAEEDIAAVRDAVTGSEGRYVLKPQREGGGYNFYGAKLAKKLRENIQESSGSTLKLGSKLAEYILMERLFPPQQRAVLLRSGMIEGVGDSVSELGCFGTIVATHDGEVTHNDYAGFLLRTKFSKVDEGGVASGFATLSSPYLC